jgi:hypothetical protein
MAHPLLPRLRLVSVATVLGCASVPSGRAPAGDASPGGVPAARLDSVVADTLHPAGRVYRAAEVGRRAAVLPGQPLPRWGQGVDGCAELGYVVGVDGRVEPGTLAVRDGSTAPMAEALIRALPAERYRPAEQPAARPVRQLIQLVALKRGGNVTIARDADLLPGRCPRPEV